jgi:hypothetical protein
MKIMTGTTMHFYDPYRFFCSISLDFMVFIVVLNIIMYDKNIHIL